jgi:6-phosphogluconolactonase
MKTIQLLSVLLIGCILSSHANADQQLFYLASQQDKTVVVSAVNEKTGALEEKHKITLPGNLGPMAFSPDRKLIYAAQTNAGDLPAVVSTLQRQPDGSLKLLKTAKINSRAPYIQVDKSGKFLLAAHYGPGEVTMYRIVDGLCSDEMLDLHKTEKTAHCIEVDPSGKFVFVPHTAPNKVYQYTLDATAGKLVPNKRPFAKGPDEDHLYHQPRHITHHAVLKMAFTSNERGGGISSWKFNGRNGTLKLVETLSTLPPNYEGSSAAADIHITPNGQFAYVSNRDVTKRPDGTAMKDTLAAVSIEPKTGKMKIVGHYPTGHHPRSFCIDLTGNFLFAAGQRSSNLYAYRINQKTGALEHLKTYSTGGTPIWVMCGWQKP